MDKKEQILHYHRIDGLSQREIARRVGVCRKTVKRYITEYEAQVQSDPEDGFKSIWSKNIICVCNYNPLDGDDLAFKNLQYR